MKVIFCLHHFLPDAIGGTEIYTLRLAQGLNRLGIEAVVLVPFFDNKETVESDYEGVRVIRYAESSREDRQMILGKKGPAGLAEFERILITEKPALIHFHELAPGRGVNIFHVAKANELRIPIFLTFHLSYYSCFHGSLIYKDRIKCDGKIDVKRCSDCIYHSKQINGLKGKVLGMTANTLFQLGLDTTQWNSSLGTALGFPFVVHKTHQNLLQLSTFAEKIIVLADWYKDVLIKNGVPEEKISCIKQGLTTEIDAAVNHKKVTHPLKLVFVGRISRLKGLDLLIDAVHNLPEGKFSLDIYGQENDSAYVERCKQKSLTMKNIHWKGTLPAELVSRKLGDYDLLCLPSTFSEMSPLVIQEAFAAGIPVLASDVYGNAEQVKDELNGWLFKYKDAEDLALKLSMLSEDFDRIERAKKQLPVPPRFESIALAHADLYAPVRFS